MFTCNNYIQMHMITRSKLLPVQKALKCKLSKAMLGQKLQF